jgi:hypothetical protein
MKITYACTYVEKTAEEDSYENGTVDGTFVCTMSQTDNIVAPTLVKLIYRIGNAFGLDTDDVFIPGEDDEPVTHIGFNRLEDVDGNEPTESQMEGFKRGEVKLYLADYTFAIEKRIEDQITRDEFTRAGIKTH